MSAAPTWAEVGSGSTVYLRLTPTYANMLHDEAASADDDNARLAQQVLTCLNGERERLVEAHVQRIVIPWTAERGQYAYYEVVVPELDNEPLGVSIEDLAL